MTVYDIKCVHKGYPWRVCLVKVRWKSHWTYSIFTEHNCYTKANAKTSRNMTCALVANEMYGLNIDTLSNEPKMKFRHIQRTYEYTTSYIKALEGEEEGVRDEIR
jgi:hypothetical protein